MPKLGGFFQSPGEVCKGEDVASRCRKATQGAPGRNPSNDSVGVTHTKGVEGGKAGATTMARQHLSGKITDVQSSRLGAKRMTPFCVSFTSQVSEVNQP